MKKIYLIKTKVIFLCFYVLCIISFYHIGYSQLGFRYEPLSVWRIFYNLIFLLPYIIGGNLVLFLGFSDKRRWLVNLGSVLSCCALLYYFFHLKIDTGLEILAIPFINMYQLFFIGLFTCFIYFMGEVFETISDKWNQRKIKF